MPIPLRYFATLFTLLLLVPLAQTEEARGRFPETMTVTVVDEEGKPITNANGFHRFGKYVNFKVDENGIFEISMKDVEKWKVTDFTVQAEGYGPFSAHFSEDPIIPETFTVVMKPAQKIGGIVVDEEGNPVEDVNVQCAIFFETNYKVADLFFTPIKTKTDAEGKWSLFQLPATFNAFPNLSLQKEGYLKMGVNNIPVARLNPDAAGQFNEKIVLERGYTFSGRVVDESRQPLEDVAVHHGIEHWTSDYKQVRSDREGNFGFENLRLNDQALLMTHAPGKAPQMLFVEIRSENKPIEIVMKPGRKVTFDVSNSSGRPLKDVTFHVVEIDGLPGSTHSMSLPFLQTDNKTDKNGRFVWNDAPDSLCEIDCRLRNYVSSYISITPDQETIALTLYRSPIRINVRDAETDEPIPAFVVKQKMYSATDTDRASSWSMPEAGTGGTMRMYFDGGKNRANSFDVQALGYKTASSRKVVLGEEDVVLEIRMQKAAETATAPDAANQQAETGLFPLSGGMILTPDGKSAANATVKIAVAAAACGPDAEPVYSDDAGKFLLSDAQHRMMGPQEFVLFITHPTGAAVISSKDFRSKHDREANVDAEPIRLLNWGRIEGALQVGDRKLEGTGLHIRWNKPDDLPVAPSFYRGTTTKKDGRFVFEQVLPGTVHVMRFVRGGDFYSSWSSYCGTVEVKPGETTVCTLGNTGRTVIGKAAVNEAVAPETIDFRQYTARLVVKPENLDDLITPELPREFWCDPSADDSESCSLARLAWDDTAEGKEYAERLARNNAANRNARFSFLQRDGTFRFDGLPAGDYALVISLSKNCGLDFTRGDWYRLSTFTVADGDETQPLDLGELSLEQNRSL